MYTLSPEVLNHALGILQQNPDMVDMLEKWTETERPEEKCPFAKIRFVEFSPGEDLCQFADKVRTMDELCCARFCHVLFPVPHYKWPHDDEGIILSHPCPCLIDIEQELPWCGDDVGRIAVGLVELARRADNG